jgi:radical SAM protein with 4Fe4S-binding SPASM domain
MISTLKDLNVSDRVETTTNGWWLEKEKSDALISAGLDRIVISVNGLSSAQIERITGARVNFENYIENIRHLYEHRGKCTIHIKTTNVSVGGSMDHFYNLFGDICDEISIENVAPLWPGVKSTANPTRGFFNDELSPVNICPYIFYHMTIHANGLVSSCFIDWERKNIIGNVNEKPLLSIWKGSPLKHLRADHLLGQRNRHEICKDCKQLVYGKADNISSCATDIYQRMML